MNESPFILFGVRKNGLFFLIRQSIIEDGNMHNRIAGPAVTNQSSKKTSPTALK